MQYIAYLLSTGYEIRPAIKPFSDGIDCSLSEQLAADMDAGRFMVQVREKDSLLR